MACDGEILYIVINFVTGIVLAVLPVRMDLLVLYTVLWIGFSIVYMRSCRRTIDVSFIITICLAYALGVLVGRSLLRPYGHLFDDNMFIDKDMHV